MNRAQHILQYFSEAEVFHSSRDPSKSLHFTRPKMVNDKPIDWDKTHRAGWKDTIAKAAKQDRKSGRY